MCHIANVAIFFFLGGGVRGKEGGGKGEGGGRREGGRGGIFLVEVLMQSFHCSFMI